MAMLNIFPLLHACDHIFLKKKNKSNSLILLCVCSDYSMQLNASRIKVLQAQDDLVTDMLESARKELLCISRDHQTYKKLLKILIVQVCRT